MAGGHPATVGSGIGPDLLTLRREAEALAGSQALAPLPTAGGEFHPALKTHGSGLPARPARAF